MRNGKHVIGFRKLVNFSTSYVLSSLHFNANLAVTRHFVVKHFPVGHSAARKTRRFVVSPRGHFAAENFAARTFLRQIIHHKLALM